MAKRNIKRKTKKRPLRIRFNKKNKRFYVLRKGKKVYIKIPKARPSQSSSASLDTSDNVRRVRQRQSQNQKVVVRNIINNLIAQPKRRRRRRQSTKHSHHPSHPSYKDQQLQLMLQKLNRLDFQKKALENMKLRVAQNEQPQPKVEPPVKQLDDDEEKKEQKVPKTIGQPKIITPARKRLNRYRAKTPPTPQSPGSTPTFSDTDDPDIIVQPDRESESKDPPQRYQRGAPSDVLDISDIKTIDQAYNYTVARDRKLPDAILRVASRALPSNKRRQIKSTINRVQQENLAFLHNVARTLGFPESTLNNLQLATLIVRKAPGLLDVRENQNIKTALKSLRPQRGMGGLGRSGVGAEQPPSKFIESLTAPLWSHQIDNIMDRYKPEYIGCRGIDQIRDLPEQDIIASCVNLSPSTEQGTHWVGLFISVPEGSVEWFDPLADPPPESFRTDIKHWLDNVIEANTLFKLKVNDVQLQSKARNNANCGYHVIRFLRKRLNGVPFKTATKYERTKGKVNEAEQEIEEYKKDLKQKGFGYI